MATLDHGRKEGLLLLVVFQSRVQEAVVHACSSNASLRPRIRTCSHSLTWRRRIRGGTSESSWPTHLLSPADGRSNARLVPLHIAVTASVPSFNLIRAQRGRASCVPWRLRTAHRSSTLSFSSMSLE